MEQKYKRAPTMKEIRFVIKASGMSVERFEKFYGIASQAIKSYQIGVRPFPEKYWHLFFDPPKPIREKIDAMDAFRAKCRSIVCNKTMPHKSRFEKYQTKKEQKTSVKKIGVLADLLR